MPPTSRPDCRQPAEARPARSERRIAIDKTDLGESDTHAKFIIPALLRAGWDEATQIRREVSFTEGRIIVRGRPVSWGKGKRADYILSYKPNIPIALIEAYDCSLLFCQSHCCPSRMKC